jgi:hypothetical protein
VPVPIPSVSGQRESKISLNAETSSTTMTQPPIPVRVDRPVLGPEIDWAAVLAAHDRWLRTVVYSRLGEPQAVEDVMQEVFVAAIRQHSPLADAS